MYRLGFGVSGVGNEITPTWTLKVCRIIASYRYWAIILLTFEETLNPKP